MRRNYAVLAAAMLLAACVGPMERDWPTYEKAADSQLIAANYRAADHLWNRVSQAVDRSAPLAAGPVVNIDDRAYSSRLGRVISEHVASRLLQHGVPVFDTGSRVAPGIRGPGDSRAAADAWSARSASVVGVYAPALDYVYITLKLVRSTDQQVLATHDYVLPLDANVRSLLAR